MIVEISVDEEDKKSQRTIECAQAIPVEELERVTQVLRQEITKRTQAESQQQELEKNLLEVSRQAGMAEIATGVLHNVGNVLNSVNVSTNLISNKLRNGRANDLMKVVALINQHRDDLGSFFTLNEKGRQLPDFLEKLADCIRSEAEDVVQEFQSVAKNVEHIKEIIRAQQSSARIIGVKEELELVDVIEDAIIINEAGFDRHGASLTREYLNTPRIEIERHKVLQIMVNLLSNAKYAVDDAKNQEKLVTVRIEQENEQRLRIQVIDTGVGIAAQDLPKVFSHGFTTKEEGHGFGLHSSSLAAKELGGTLTADSAGLGQGAVFTLSLPISSEVKMEMTTIV